MQLAEARQPISVCPSPPMFQKRILNAGVTAREMHSSIATSRKVTHVLRGVPNVPLMMVL